MDCHAVAWLPDAKLALGRHVGVLSTFMDLRDKLSIWSTGHTESSVELDGRIDRVRSGFKHGDLDV
jgi:hypothetical protein